MQDAVENLTRHVGEPVLLWHGADVPESLEELRESKESRDFPLARREQVPT